MVDVGLFISYILIGVCVLTAVGMPLVKAFGDPDSLKKMGIGVGALLVVFVISYLIADGTPQGDASGTTAKMVGAGIYTFYILALGAVGGIVYTEIKKAAE
ncbi:MAG: hypothetical protein HRT61_08800 [Ekhidna sp.]|nr:hypothetical protein [Ekhidna sp.]